MHLQTEQHFGVTDGEKIRTHPGLDLRVEIEQRIALATDARLLPTFCAMSSCRIPNSPANRA